MIGMQILDGCLVMMDAWTVAYKAGGYQNKVILRYIPVLMANSLLGY